MKLQKFKLGTVDYGFIDGGDKIIITETDFQHYVFHDIPGSIELSAGYKEGDPTPDGEGHYLVEVSENITIAQIREIAQPIEQLRGWAHYWGVKDRIWDNYAWFLDSMLEIGVSTEDMPTREDWKEVREKLYAR